MYEEHNKEKIQPETADSDDEDNNYASVWHDDTGQKHNKVLPK